MMYDYSRMFSVAHRQAVVFFSRHLEKLDVSGGQFPYLFCIRDHPGLTQDQLAEKTMTDKSTAAKAVRQLVDAGYVERRVSDDDRRAYNLYNTAKAETVYKHIGEAIDLFNTRLTRGLTEVERLLLQMLLEKLHLEREPR